MNHSFIESARRASPRGPRRQPARLAALAEAAARVFARQGWRLAQVAEVAAEAGIAAGTVYLYAADKPALLDLALRAAARLELPEEAALPARGDLAATLRLALASRLVLPRLAALRAGEAAGPATLRGLLEELYDLLAREARLILLLDRLGLELPEVAEAFGGGRRAVAFRDLAAGLRQLGQQGLARDDLEPETAMRAVLEMFAWMAMRRARDPLPPAADDATARATALALAEAALAPPCRG